MREFGFRNSENFWLWNQESSKYLLRNPDILENFCFGIRNPGKFLNPESGNFCDFGLRNTAQRIRNPTNDSNPESASSIDKVFGRNPVPGIRNPWPGIQNPRLSRIPIHGLVKGSSVFFATFSVVISASQEIRLIYHTHDDFDIADPSSTQDACHTWTLYTAQLALRSLVVRASDRCAEGHRFNCCRELIFFFVPCSWDSSPGEPQISILQYQITFLQCWHTVDSVTGSFWFTLMHARKPQMVLS